jgi:hypothetical protein
MIGAFAELSRVFVRRTAPNHPRTEIYFASIARQALIRVSPTRLAHDFEINGPLLSAIETNDRAFRGPLAMTPCPIERNNRSGFHSIAPALTPLETVLANWLRELLLNRIQARP